MQGSDALQRLTREGCRCLPVFYACDRGEPSHVHVERDDNVAKFWLEPLRLASSGGFPRHEIARLNMLVLEYRMQLLEAWNEYFHS